MGTRYSHVTQADRISIQALMQAKHNGPEIARQLGLSRSTVNREINCGKASPTSDQQLGDFGCVEGHGFGFEVRQRLSDRTAPVLTSGQNSNWQITARWDFPVMGETIARRNAGLRRAEAAEAERVARTVQADLQALDARINIAERSVVALSRQLQQYDQLVRAGGLQFDAGRRSLQQLISLRDSRYSVAQRRADQENRLLAARMRQLALTGQLPPALGLGS